MRLGRRCAAAALAALLGGSAAAAAPAAPTPDVLAARLRALDDLGIQAGILAQRRGQSDAVRRYGRVLERDRRLSEGRVAATARSQGLRLGAPPEGSEESALLVRLEGVPEEQFDREFLLALSRAQGAAAARLREDRRLTPDRELAELIERLLPVLEQDRELAERLRARGGGAGRSYGG